MHTEDEARAKDCPERDNAPFKCRASDCMAWRWGGETQITMRVYEGRARWTEYQNARFQKGGSSASIDRPFQFAGSWWRYTFTSHDTIGRFDTLTRSPDENTPKTGYCGLAGNPEGQGDGT